MIELERDGVRWKLQPDFAPLLDDVLQSPGEIVKESPVKRVSRHRVGEKAFFVKRYLHHAVALRSFKFLFKPTQASQEWELAQQLEERKIPIVRHAALGERRSWRGVEESILVTESFDGVEVEQCPWVDPLAVLRFVEQMHERGVVQEDLHLANLLVRKDPFELRLVDLHGTRVEERLRPEERSKNIALLRVFMEIPIAPEVMQLSRRLRREKLFERAKRCLRSNRDFTRTRAGGLWWRVRGPFRSPAVDAVMADPDGFLESRAKILKPGRSATVGLAEGLVLKRFNFRNPWNLLKDFFRPSRARRAFRKGYHLELVGVPTARSIATADRGACGVSIQSYLLMEEIPGAVDLRAYLRSGRAVEAGLIRRAAALIARLHDEGFSHRDLKESNLVLDTDGRLLLIDLDGLSFEGELAESRAARDLSRLLLVQSKHPVLSTRHRLGFLLAYCRARRIKSVPRV